MKRTALVRRTPIRARRNKPETRVGKLGIVRLKGGAMYQLRMDCFLRDLRCDRCDQIIKYFNARFVGDPEAFDMAHIKSRGAGGSDVIENVKAMHHKCHMQEHSTGNNLPQ